MTILSGIPLHSLLDALPAQAMPPVLAVSGQGIVLFLQAVAYVLVSLAAIAVLLRFGLRGGQSRCGCHGKRGSESAALCTGVTASDVQHGDCGCGSARQPDALAHAGQEAGLRTVQSAATARAAMPNGESQPLATGRLPERGRLNATQEAGADAAAHIKAAAALAGANTIDADEQRRITAVIAAAVHNVLGGQAHRIVRIQPISHGWAQEGRRDIFSSHRIR